ncbi:MAG: tRNA uridine-5-carboxymethylaminomethyl(34) synthesis GTPase MnmE [Oscillospiraceae bacterium]|nr:tRNA uridine-5-carboxymethylaminomethyl(34) synthesis GTPase MnmE [Oscillospiraceae bacterium]
MSTIAAIATPIGVGSISVIRISGENCFKIADKIFVSCDGISLNQLSGYHAKFGSIFYKNKFIDEVVALVFRAPKSYTGENIIEISCHGGIYITKCILRAILDSGAKLANPGEFTKRAFLNDKISLEKAESVMGLISANHLKAQEMYSSSFNGDLGLKINKIKSYFIDILSGIDAYIDYPDEDILEVDINKIKEKIISANYEISKLIKTFSFGRAIKQGVRIAIIGAPNSGKSTFMNLLSNSEKSIVTDIPGTTRDIIEETVIFGDLPIVLIDTAGIRETKDKIEKIGVEKSFQAAKTAEIIFMIFDSSKEISKKEIEILEFFKKYKILCILNKIDLDKKISVSLIKKYSKNITQISAKTGLGIENLKKKLNEILGFKKSENENLIIANERQYDILNRSIQSSEKILKFLEFEPLDIIAELIKETLEILTEFTGENINIEVIDAIFSKFCVGK